MLHQQDWAVNDLEALAYDAIPVTAYKPAGSTSGYDKAYDSWADAEKSPARSSYRIAWRLMAANTGERTFIPALIPPGPAHVDGVYSAGFPSSDPRKLVECAATFVSLLSDFAVRAVPKSAIRSGVVNRLPFDPEFPLLDAMALRMLRLNCVTNAYEPLWSDVLREIDLRDSWTGGLHYQARPRLEDVSGEWSPLSPLRRATDRRQALLEIDALVAMMLGLTADELCTIYRTQFAVLHGYDRTTYFYDANGRLVPNSVLTVWRKKADDISLEERTATNASGNTYTYELPFVTLDREADMRQAYAHFEKLLAERSGA
jgi:hypothetical protein